MAVYPFPQHPLPTEFTLLARLGHSAVGPKKIAFGPFTPSTDLVTAAFASGFSDAHRWFPPEVGEAKWLR